MQSRRRGDTSTYVFDCYHNDAVSFFARTAGWPDSEYRTQARLRPPPEHICDIEVL